MPPRARPGSPRPGPPAPASGGVARAGTPPPPRAKAPGRPGTFDPGAGRPGTPDPGATTQRPRPGTPDPGATAGGARPGTPDPGAVNARPGTPDPGAVSAGHGMPNLGAVIARPERPEPGDLGGASVGRGDEMRYMEDDVNDDMMLEEGDVEGDDGAAEMLQQDTVYSVQMMAEMLVTGSDAQRDFILFELQQLLDHCPDDTMKILLPVLCDNVPNWGLDLQTKATQRLYNVVGLELSPDLVTIITKAVFGVVESAMGIDSSPVANLYGICGSILIELLPSMHWTPADIGGVIRVVDMHAYQPLATSRKIAARVLGALASCFDETRVEKDVLPRVERLFEDPDVEVRGVVIESLAFIGAALPIRVTEDRVWGQVSQLLNTKEDARIYGTALRTMAHILQKQREKGVSGRLFRDLLPPVFETVSVFARKNAILDQRLVDDETYMKLEVISEVFGQILYSMSLHSRNRQRLQLQKSSLKAFSVMATCNGPLIRRACSFNLPGVIKALGERFALELSGLCEFLAKDTDEEVRWILAAGIHQSAALLCASPRGSHDRLFSAVRSLLEDENPLVRMNALEHFHELLSAFVKDSTDLSSLRRLAPVFSNLSVLSDGDWRIQQCLAEQLDKCTEIIPPEALVENVLPLLYRLTEQGTPLVRHAGMCAIARALRSIPTEKDREQCVSRFWAQGMSGPFWMRLALLDGGSAALKIFSGKRFGDMFAPTLLQLAADPVANVRIRIAILLPEMAPTCDHMPAYAKAVEMLRNDKDMDVLHAMASHKKAEQTAWARAKSLVAIDDAKYRDEQEAWGYMARSSKRPRRLPNIRSNRMLSNTSRRRDSSDNLSEQSSGHISVSPALVSAAKASSAAAIAASSSPTTAGTPSDHNGAGQEDTLQQQQLAQLAQQQLAQQQVEQQLIMKQQQQQVAERPKRNSRPPSPGGRPESPGSTRPVSPAGRSGSPVSRPSSPAEIAGAAGRPTSPSSAGQVAGRPHSPSASATESSSATLQGVNERPASPAGPHRPLPPLPPFRPASPADTDTSVSTSSVSLSSVASGQTDSANATGATQTADVVSAATQANVHSKLLPLETPASSPGVAVNEGTSSQSASLAQPLRKRRSVSTIQGTKSQPSSNQMTKDWLSNSSTHNPLLHGETASMPKLGFKSSTAMAMGDHIDVDMDAKSMANLPFSFAGGQPIGVAPSGRSRQTGSALGNSSGNGTPQQAASRASSWTHRFANIPRQLSMDHRKSSPYPAADGQGVANDGSGGPLGKVGSFHRRRRSKRVSAGANVVQHLQQQTLGSTEQHSVSDGPRSLSVSSDFARSNDYDGPVSSQSQSSIVMEGRTMSVDERVLGERRQMALKLGLNTPEVAYNGAPVEFDSSTGLPSFKGAAPWMRIEGATQVRYPSGKMLTLSSFESMTAEMLHDLQLAQMASSLPRPTQANRAHTTVSPHSRNAHVQSDHSFGGAKSSRSANPSVVSHSSVPFNSNGEGSARSGPAGFLRSMFEWKKR